MSKVKIQGNASGTGVLTVTAPNTSTDRTITLPDATGTLLNSDGDGSSLTGVGVDGISSSADATAITIDSAENVMVNKTSQDMATVGSQFRGDATGLLQITRDGAEALHLNRLTDDGNVLSVYKDTTLKGSIAVTGSGIGIQLGGTAAANTLDDYEEGTWTPTFSGSHIGSHTLNYANYVKVGRLVTINMYVYNFGSIGGTGISFGITSLPFSQNVQALGVVTATHTDFHNSYGHAVARLYNGVAYIEQTKDAASGHWLDYSAFNANSHVQMSITYETSV